MSPGGAMGLMQRNNLARGYTMVEVLMIGVIIVLLGAMLFPALNKGRRKAHVAQCTSQLRQIGQGLMLYDMDHDNALENYPDRVTHMAQLQYVTDARVFVCAADGTRALGAGLKPGAAVDSKAEWAERETNPLLGGVLREANSSYLYEFSTRDCDPNWWEYNLVYWDEFDEPWWTPEVTDVDRDGDGNVTWQEAKFWQQENGDTYCTGQSAPGMDGIPEELYNMPNAYDMITDGSATWQKGYPRTWMPVLRCFWHQSADTIDSEYVMEIMNLSLDGNVFYSAPYWENTAFQQGRTWQDSSYGPGSEEE